jgi:hypothetical protein
MVSTWEVKQREHSGEHEVLDKNMQNVVANTDYALAA